MEPGHSADGVIFYADPIEGFEPRTDAHNVVHACDFLRETDKGIAVERNPDAMLLDAPELWDVVQAWRHTRIKDLSLADYRREDCFFISCWTVLYGAWGREVMRQREKTDG